MSDETEIERLRARIRELEAELAVAYGTMQFQRLRLDGDEPGATITHHPPNAPPHDTTPKES